jgi:hypothetical protein
MSSLTIPLFGFLGAHVDLIFAPTTKGSLSSAPKNVSFLDIAICIKASSA